VLVQPSSALPGLSAAAPKQQRQVQFSNGLPQDPPHHSMPGLVLDLGHLPTQPCNGTMTSAARLPAICAVVFILCFVTGAQAFPASRLRAHELPVLYDSSATTNINFFLPLPEFPPFPGTFAQGVIVGPM
jgi:hypothetical protein